MEIVKNKDDIVVEIKIPRLKALDQFVEDFKSGIVEKAVVIYEADDKLFYRVFTESPNSEIGWLLVKTLLAMASEEIIESGD